MVFSAGCSTEEHSFQDAGKYHGDVALGTPSEESPQWSTTWLQGTTFHVVINTSSQLGVLLLAQVHCDVSVVVCTLQLHVLTKYSSLYPQTASRSSSISVVSQHAKDTGLTPDRESVLINKQGSFVMVVNSAASVALVSLLFVAALTGHCTPPAV